MEKAIKEAEQALKAREFPVGCVMVYNNEIIANGSRKGTAKQVKNEIDHAEIICLKNLFEIEKKQEIDKNKITVYCTMEPCLMCYGALLINNIRNIVYSYEDAMGGGTGARLESLPPLYSKNPVNIVPGILREKSLRIFQEFFSSPDNSYLDNTLLAKYTLEQI